MVAAVPEAVDWSQDEYWQRRKLSPAQILVHDVRIAQKSWQTDDASSGPWVDQDEILSSSLLKDLEGRDELENSIDFKSLTNSGHEQARLRNLAHQYGWLNTLRGKGVQQSIRDPPELRKCRWIHISSKFTEYLQGALLALSDWNSHPEAGKAIVANIRRLNQCMQQNERFSKHGRYFAPFLEPLSNAKTGGPVLMSVPFMDWSVDPSEPTPPLRFQVDPREGYQSTRNSAHMLRSILQHYYRLEDTSEREAHQVFSKYRPWLNDRYLDLKIRRWYGQYPASLNVDELWILVVDSRHIVTFSSNQSWKSRWPPLQFASRVAEISFRSIRDDLYRGAEGSTDYTAYTHSVACLSGALGLLHRSFWSDLPLCIVDRYAGYLSHLQYRLLRAPSTKLVMDLLQVQEELNIIIQVMRQQIELVECVQSEWDLEVVDRLSLPRSRSSSMIRPQSMATRVHHANQSRSRRYSASFVSDPMNQLLDSLRRECDDLCELRDNSNTLVNRTIQLVNIRLEDHGKAIMTFTIVTLIFLPLSFVSSYFGMNTRDIRDMDATQSRFWVVSASVTIGVVGLAVFVAFYGGIIMETLSIWVKHYKDSRQKNTAKKSPLPRRPSGFSNFEVIGTSSF